MDDVCFCTGQRIGHVEANIILVAGFTFCWEGLVLCWLTDGYEVNISTSSAFLRQCSTQCVTLYCGLTSCSLFSIVWRERSISRSDQELNNTAVLVTLFSSATLSSSLCLLRSFKLQLRGACFIPCWEDAPGPHLWCLYVFL